MNLALLCQTTPPEMNKYVVVHCDGQIGVEVRQDDVEPPFHLPHRLEKNYEFLMHDLEILHVECSFHTKLVQVYICLLERTLSSNKQLDFLQRSNRKRAMSLGETTTKLNSRIERNTSLQLEKAEIKKYVREGASGPIVPDGESEPIEVGTNASCVTPDRET